MHFHAKRFRKMGHKFVPFFWLLNSLILKVASKSPRLFKAGVGGWLRKLMQRAIIF